MKPISDIINQNTKKISSANTLPQFSNLRPISQGSCQNYRHIPKTNFEFVNPAIDRAKIHNSCKPNSNNYLVSNQQENGLKYF